MIKLGNYILYFTALLFFCTPILAQDTLTKNDTFFLAKKSGLLGRLGKSISRTPPNETPTKIANPFLKYQGKIIRRIDVIGVGFDHDIEDTFKIKNNVLVGIAKKFHKNTNDRVMLRNLFFKEGDTLSPYLLADNERFLRELIYLKDARILVIPVADNTELVDVIVLTKDVFSIGLKLFINSTEEGRSELKEENFLGTGTRLLVSGYYDKFRNPQFGIGGEVIKRNIGGTFIDFIAGYKDYGNAFSSDLNQETVMYTKLDKPMVTPYMPSTGALEWSYQKTRNVYQTDSIYQTDIKYRYYIVDAWYGYSLSKLGIHIDSKQSRVNQFFAFRYFKQFYQVIPTKYKSQYDYRFADQTGILTSLYFFKQSFYKTKFIYGFGRNEDVPEGFNMTFTAGLINKQNTNRPYSGIDLSFTNFRKKGFYSSYSFRTGGYFNKKRFEDVDLLFRVDHFTRLRKLNAAWFNRFFIVSGFATQINPVLNAPLFINNDYGLDYFDNGNLRSDLRATIKMESVFYNTTKYLGFRFAPFVFSDAVMVKPIKMNLNKIDIFTAIGGGVRTRNENLVFGTVELKAYYFPRVIGGMNRFKVDLNSNIRFKFKSNFISRPDVINNNQ